MHETKSFTKLKAMHVKTRFQDFQNHACVRIQMMNKMIMHPSNCNKQNPSNDDANQIC